MITKLGKYIHVGLLAFASLVVASGHSFSDEIEGTNCSRVDPTPAIKCVGWEGAIVTFPNGEISFADRVIRYNPLYSDGPIPTDTKFIDPESALGPPDFPVSGSDEVGSVSLGRGGLIELLFADNRITNSGDSNPDLYVFEIGELEDSLVALRATPNTERTLEALCDSNGDGSLDACDANDDGYLEVGRISGLTSSLDIDSFFPGFKARDLEFDAVQLIDVFDHSQQNGKTVGADIDAVGAISSSPTFAITTTLFAFKLGEDVSVQFKTLGGEAPFDWSVVDGALPKGISLSKDGMFSGKPTALGSSEFTVHAVDSEGVASEKTFSVAIALVTPPSSIRLSKSGTTPVPGRNLDYFIVVQNTGSDVAEYFTVTEYLEPWFTYISATPAPTSLRESTDTFPLTDNSMLYVAFLQWGISGLGPGNTRILQYTVELDSTIPIGHVVHGRACRLREKLAICAEITDSCTVEIPACAVSEGVFSEKCEDLAKACWIDVLKCLISHSFECVDDKSKTTYPVDPNEKLTAAKYRRLENGSIRSFIQPEQQLIFPIHFENIGDVEAIDVFITDILDANLDESTLELLTPKGGSYDATTRTIRWDLLERNLLPGGTGNVILSIKPKPGLPSGTEIRNSAKIQFEIFDPIVTPEVVSVIDTTKPKCKVDELPSKTSKEEISLSWSGTDEIGEIDNYSIFVSENGGTFSPLFAETKETTGTFIGSKGKAYGFFCVAKDSAGNVEDQELVAEAAVRIKDDRCFIATAVYESPLASDVQILRNFRDQYLLTNQLGQKFVQQYYKHSPALAQHIRDSEALKFLVRAALVPVVATAKFWLESNMWSKTIFIATFFLTCMLAFLAARWLVSRVRGAKLSVTLRK